MTERRGLGDATCFPQSLGYAATAPEEADLFWVRGGTHVKMDLTGNSTCTVLRGPELSLIDLIFSQFYRSRNSVLSVFLA